MDSGVRTQDPHSPSIGSPMDQAPLLKNSFEERGLDEEKAFEEESEIFSSQLRENSTQRQGKNLGCFCGGLREGWDQGPRVLSVG